ncbi:hypothetical protein PYW08_013015 [Mythimna loreyi]|uniref:Uncharacterized protein n=1 Tax=Mythimna loreyi TaxID=667449 RepID=A0ACC2Q2F7_9NEOP|nr:hypothetical protein PYW08_013015 [Mythimna loreyi]
MPKRSAKDKIDRYNKKIRKLEEKERRQSRRRSRVLQFSDSDVDLDNVAAVDDADNVDMDESANPQLTDVPEIPVSDPGLPETTDVRPVELDPEILSALGEPADDSPEFGENIHQDLAQRWQPILKRGLPKEVTDKLLKEYLVPSN